MKKPLFAFLLAAALVGPAAAQTPAPATPGGSRSDEILKKISKLDALIQIVPLVLTKTQIPPLLTAIEKVRQKQKDLYAVEDKELAELDAKISKAVDEGVEKDKYPSRELQLEIAAKLRAAGQRRIAYNAALVPIVVDACKATLNAGQLKTMEKSLKPELLEPGIKADEMDSDAKIAFFVRKVLLDPTAYDVLVAMSKRKD